MRYVEGADLGALLRARPGALEPQRAARIVAQIGAALDAAHARGLVHRDVKPANVLVADPGGAEHCYLTDFGLTKQTVTTDDATVTQTGRGHGHRPVHGARSSCAGAAVDARTDVYALGCVLYRAAGGRAAVQARHATSRRCSRTCRRPPLEARRAVRRRRRTRAGEGSRRALPDRPATSAAPRWRPRETASPHRRASRAVRAVPRRRWIVALAGSRCWPPAAPRSPPCSPAAEACR